MKPALRDEPTTNETPLARAAGKTLWSAFLWSISEYCEASRQTSGSATSSSFMIGSGLFTPRPQPLMIPSSRIRVRAGKAPLRAISNCSSQGVGRLELSGEIAEPALAQAEAIPGRGVVIADTRAPCRFECGIGDLLRDNREFIAKRYAAQTEADWGLVVFRRSCL